MREKPGIPWWICDNCGLRKPTTPALSERTPDMGQPITPDTEAEEDDDFTITFSTALPQDAQDTRQDAEDTDV